MCASVSVAPNDRELKASERLVFMESDGANHSVLDVFFLSFRSSLGIFSIALHYLSRIQFSWAAWGGQKVSTSAEVMTEEVASWTGPLLSQQAETLHASWLLFKICGLTSIGFNERFADKKKREKILGPLNGSSASYFPIKLISRKGLS